MPENCEKINPDFVENRKAYFQEKDEELLQLGLQRAKAFWRCETFYLGHTGSDHPLEMMAW